VRALLATYHRIDVAQTAASLWIENDASQQWIAATTGDDIAANRDAVLKRGRAQIH
jgi:enoyl-CoA hydratase